MNSKLKELVEELESHLTSRSELKRKHAEDLREVDTRIGLVTAKLSSLISILLEQQTTNTQQTR